MAPIVLPTDRADQRVERPLTRLALSQRSVIRQLTVRVAQALEVDQVGASASRTLHRNEVIQRTDRCLDAVDAFDVSARPHVVKRRR
jgi:hypothetical protein